MSANPGTQVWLSHITLVTDNVTRLTDFYGACLQVELKLSSGGYGYFELGQVRLAIVDRATIADYTGMENSTVLERSGILLSLNLASPDILLQALERVTTLGGTVVKPATWHGARLLSGTFTDPDGNGWEISCRMDTPGT